MGVYQSKNEFFFLLNKNKQQAVSDKHWLVVWGFFFYLQLKSTKAYKEHFLKHETPKHAIHDYAIHIYDI